MPFTFHPTQSDLATLLPRVSDFQRRRRQAGPLADGGVMHTLPSTLEPSLLQDLQRFEPPTRQAEGLEVLQVVAAAVRHARPLLLLLDHEGLVLPLTVMPLERVVRTALAPSQWDLLRWASLKVLRVEPAPPAGEAEVPPSPPSHQAPLGQPIHQAPLGQPIHQAPLGLVLWALALHGSRAELLPEIAGPAAYRIAPSTDFSGLELAGSLASAVARLRRQASVLSEISAWPGFDRNRAMRLLNGLYLQSGLIVTRMHRATAGA